jgi:hypothetical protein
MLRLRKRKVEPWSRTAPSPYMTPSEKLRYARHKRAGVNDGQTIHNYDPKKYKIALRPRSPERDPTRGGTREVGLPIDPKTTRERIKESFLQSKLIIDDVLWRVHDKVDTVTGRKPNEAYLRQASKYFKHKHYPQSNDNADHEFSTLHKLKHQASMFIERSTTFAHFAQSLRQHSQNLADDGSEVGEQYPTLLHKPFPNFEGEYLNENDEESILLWINGTDEGEGVDLFKIISTAQLIKSNGANFDTRINNYHGPPPSPEPEPEKQQLQLQKQMQMQGQEEDVGALPEEMEPKRKYKDLIKYLGTELPGLYISKDFPSASPYFDRNNVSDYYEMQLIGEEHEEIDSKYDPEPPSWDADYYDARAEMILEKRSVPPGQSLILYLRSRGFDIYDIAIKIVHLDPEFLYKQTKRTMRNGYRVPEYWNMDETVLPKLRRAACAPLLRWEQPGALNCEGVPYPPLYKQAKAKLRERAVRRFVVNVLENHLCFRLFCGYRPHTDLIA